MSFTEEITSERLNRRQFVKVAAGSTLGLAALLAGCGSSTGSSLNSNGSAAIEFLAVQQAGTGWPLVLSTITDQYAKTHAGTTFKVDFAGQTGLNQKVQLLAAQGALPVLYNTPPADLMAQLVKNGEGLDIESTFQQLGVFQELVPSAVALLKQVYGSPLTELPFELNIEGFWYNKQIFAQNGLQPPDTWDQLVQIAASLQQKGIQPFSASGIQGWPITRLIGNYLFRKLGPNALDSIKSGSGCVPLWQSRHVLHGQLGAARLHHSLSEQDRRRQRRLLPVPQRHRRDRELDPDTHERRSAYLDEQEEVQRHHWAMARVHGQELRRRCTAEGGGGDGLCRA
jgi:hypothetical protein